MAAGGIAARYKVPITNHFGDVCHVSGGSKLSQGSGVLTYDVSEEAVMEWFVDGISDYEPGTCRATAETRELKVCQTALQPWLDSLHNICSNYNNEPLLVFLLHMRPHVSGWEAAWQATPAYAFDSCGSGLPSG